MSVTDIKMSNDNTTNTFASMVRSFLTNNPAILDTLVAILHNVAEELDSMKDSRAISSGRYMSPYAFKQKALERTMKKLGYKVSDIRELCNQGRGDELLQEIDKLERASKGNPSRRDIPSLKSRSMRTSIKIEDITDQK
jgi:hypothetical protein